MKAVPVSEADRGRRRNAAVIVEDPSLVVVEGPGTADPGAARDALELLVKWAVRAHKGPEQAMDDAQTIAASAGENAGEST
jgi:hypothetical protein